MLLACTQPGEERIHPAQQAAPATAACAELGECPAGNAPAGSPKPAKPAVPAVPNSPIKADCAKLPTQVERDTCTNRKLSTG
jgi:hypothetical protein